MQENFKTNVENILNEIKEMLISKNEKYGNSALDPIRIFSKCNNEEQIRVRIDDKLSRLKSYNNIDDEDTINDLIGYLVLLKIAQKKL